MEGRGKLAERRSTSSSRRTPQAKGDAGVDEIFADARRQPDSAAGKTLALLKQEGRRPKQLIDAARVLVFLKGNDAHDYKFSSAVLEDYYHVSPRGANMFLAVQHVQPAAQQGAGQRSGEANGSGAG